MSPICGVCGQALEKLGDKYVCTTCESFFPSETQFIRSLEGSNVVVMKCINNSCSTEFGSLPHIENNLIEYIGITILKNWSRICPQCRTACGWDPTIRDLIRRYIEYAIDERERITFIRDFMRKGIPKKFIDFCLDKK